MEEALGIPFVFQQNRAIDIFLYKRSKISGDVRDARETMSFTGNDRGGIYYPKEHSTFGKTT